MTPLHNVPDVAAFVADRLGGGGRFTDCATMGWRMGDEVAGVVFHNWLKAFGTIEVSAVSDVRGMWSPRRIGELMAYPFDQLGCRAVIARCSERNVRARRIMARLGAVEHVIPDLRADGEAECMCVLHRAAWEQRSERYG